MAPPAVIGNDRRGPVAECVDARAVHRSLSWFTYRPGLPASPGRATRGEATQGRRGKACPESVDGPEPRHGSRPDGLRVAQPRQTGGTKRVRRSLSQAKA